MRIWVMSPSVLKTAALSELIVDIGFEAHAECGSDTDLALWDLLEVFAPDYPCPPGLPTLALIHGDEDEVLALLLKGYHGYLGATSSSRILRQALEAVYRGEIWAERRLLARAMAQLTSGPARQPPRGPSPDLS